MPKKAIKDIIVNHFPLSKSIAVKKGTSIYTEGSPINGVYLLINGSFKIVKKKKNYDSFVLWYAEEGDLVGLYSFFNNQKHNFDVTASENSKYIQISNTDFKTLLNTDPKIKKQLLTVLCSRIDYIEKRLSKMQKKTASRLADAILFYGNKVKEKENSYTFSYDPEELASIVGTTQSYLKKLLKEFANKDLILKSRKLLTPKDILALKALANAS